MKCQVPWFCLKFFIGKGGKKEKRRMRERVNKTKLARGKFSIFLSPIPSMAACETFNLPCQSSRKQELNNNNNKKPYKYFQEFLVHKIIMYEFKVFYFLPLPTEDSNCRTLKAVSSNAHGLM